MSNKSSSGKNGNRSVSRGNTAIILLVIVAAIFGALVLVGTIAGNRQSSHGSAGGLSGSVQPPQPPQTRGPLQLVLYKITLTPTPTPPANDPCKTLNVTATASPTSFLTTAPSINYYCGGESDLLGNPNTLYACLMPQKQSAIQPVTCANGCVAGSDYDSECDGPGPSGGNLTCGDCMQSGFLYQCTKPGSATVCANYDDSLNSYYPQGYSCNRCN